MATLDEAHSTRGRANVLRLAMAGRLGESGLGDQGVFDVLDLCLECRACKSECPVGVDVARFKSEFLADYWSRHGVSRSARMLGSAHEIAKWGSHAVPLVNAIGRTRLARILNEKLFGIDRRRTLPALRHPTLTFVSESEEAPDVLLFADTFTNYYSPEIGVAALDVLRHLGCKTRVVSGFCCGRPLISKGLLERARTRAQQTADALIDDAESGRKIVVCEPGCLSALREDAPSLLRGSEQRKAQTVAAACVSFEEFVASRPKIALKPGPQQIILHAHCHQKSMGLLPVIKTVLGRIPGSTVVDPDAGCCGMAGSFGYEAKHYEISRQIGERKLFPAIRGRAAASVVVAPGFSCRHQIDDFTQTKAIHPAVLLKSLLPETA